MDIKVKSRNSIKIVFVFTLLLFIFLFIATNLSVNYTLMNMLYDEINSEYLKNLTIIPIQTENSNLNYEMNNKIKIIRNIQLESTALNLKILFKYTNQLRFNITTTYIGNQTEVNKYLTLSTRNPSLNVIDKLSAYKFYFGIMIQSFNFTIIPDEVLIYDKAHNNYFSFNYDLNSDFLKNHIDSNYNSIYTDLSKYYIANYIVENPESKIHKYNFLKLSLLKIKKDGIEFQIIFGLRIRKTEFMKMYSSRISNTSILTQVNNKFITIPASDVLDNFYFYGLSIPSETTYQKIFNSTFPTAENVSKINFNYLSKLFIMDIQIKYLDLNLFNQNLYDDFYTFAKLTMKVQKEYYGFDMLKNYLRLDSQKQCLEQKNHSKIICDLYESDICGSFINSNLSSLSKIVNGSRFENPPNKLNGSCILKKNTSNEIFSKVNIYEDTINNLRTITLQFTNVVEYNKVIEAFSTKLNNFRKYIFLILLIFSISILIISVIITMRSVNVLINTINQISELKYNIFIKESRLNTIGLDIEDKDITRIIENFKKGMGLKDKYVLCSNEKFAEENILIILDTKKKLHKLLDEIENEYKIDYLKKLTSFKRKNQLLSNYNYIKKQDQTMYVTMLNTINCFNIFPLPNIGYNIYYTQKMQNSSLNQLYKLLEISENYKSYNNDHHNKYLSFSDLLKIVFNFKKAINTLYNAKY